MRSITESKPSPDSVQRRRNPHPTLAAQGPPSPISGGKGGALAIVFVIEFVGCFAFSPRLPSPDPLPCRSSRVSQFSAISCARSAGAASMFPPSSVPMATPMSMSRRQPTGASSSARALVFVNGLGFEGSIGGAVRQPGKTKAKKVSGQRNFRAAPGGAKEKIFKHCPDVAITRLNLKTSRNTLGAGPTPIAPCPVGAVSRPPLTPRLDALDGHNRRGVVWGPLSTEPSKHRFNAA